MTTVIITRYIIIYENKTEFILNDTKTYKTFFTNFTNIIQTKVNDIASDSLNRTNIDEKKPFIQ